MRSKNQIHIEKINSERASHDLSFKSCLQIQVLIYFLALAFSPFVFKLLTILVERFSVSVPLGYFSSFFTVYISLYCCLKITGHLSGLKCFIFSAEKMNKERFAFFHYASKKLFNSLSWVAFELLARAERVLFIYVNGRLEIRGIVKILSLGISFWLNSVFVQDNKANRLVLFVFSLVVGFVLSTAICLVLLEMSKRSCLRTRKIKLNPNLREKLNYINSQVKDGDSSILGRSFLVYLFLVFCELISRIFSILRKVRLFRVLTDAFEHLVSLALEKLASLLGLIRRWLYFTFGLGISLMSILVFKVFVQQAFELRGQESLGSLLLFITLVLLSSCLSVFSYVSNCSSITRSSLAKSRIGLI